MGKCLRQDDLWHFADVLAVHPKERRFLLVQVTTIGHLANRLAKVKGRPESAIWLAAGGEIELHGWCRRKSGWHCRRLAVRLDEEIAVLAEPPRQRRSTRWKQTTLF